MIAILKRLFALLISIACSLGFPQYSDVVSEYEPLKEDCRLNFAVVSDVHMTEETARKDMFEIGMCDLDMAKEKLDALVFAGDTVTGAKKQEYDFVNDVLSNYNPADNIIMAVGNHDLSGEGIGYVEAKSRFIEYNKIIAEREIDNVYYSTVINGYTFIVLGSEDGREDAYISSAQLQWLEEEMEFAAASGKPVFVISHWPLNQTHGLPNTYPNFPFFEGDNLDPATGGLGNESDAVENILNKYSNVFLISAHTHNGINNLEDGGLHNYNSYEKKGNIHSINNPGYIYPSVKGNPLNGTGFCFEVYDDEVIVRARCYSAGVWFTESTYIIELV